MAKFGKDRFPDNYQRAVGMAASSRLHANSVELLDIIKRNDVLTDDDIIFELGAGPARNLHYIYNKFPKCGYYCSDLFYDASIQNMSQDMRENLKEFYEGDSEEVIKKLDLNIKLFILNRYRKKVKIF